MKNKIFLLLTLVLMLSLMLVVSVSAEVTTYDDAPQRTKIQIKTDEIIEFYDGFKCPAGYVFKDSSTIGTGNYNTKFEDYMDFTYINGKLGKTEEDGNLYTYADVKGFDIPTGITHVAKYAGMNGTTLKWVTFPDTITSLSNAIFQSATGLEECTFKFSENNTMRVFPSYMFYGCKNLKAFSMPDCFTSLHDVAHFSGCTSLSAVHLSNSLEVWSSGGGGSRNATFDDCVNMYFVNEAFTYDNIPQKPEVYYFPTNLKSISNNSVCRECKNLNNVLVFGTKLTEMPNQYFFQNGPANKIVFLGDMTKVSTQYWGKTTQILFANPADKSLDDVVYSGGRTTVFCNAEENAGHLAEKIVSVEAGCEVDAGLVTYCFCGREISKDAIEGTALSHDYDYLNNENAKLISFVYTNYSKSGIKTVCCANCGENGDIETAPLFECQGYSASELGNGISLGYKVNIEAINAFTSETGSTVKYGVFAVAQSKLGENNVLDQNGNATEGVISAEIKRTDFSAFDIKIVGFETDAQKSTMLAIGAYAAVTKDGVTTYSYMQEKSPLENERYSFVSYNSIVE